MLIFCHFHLSSSIGFQIFSLEEESLFPFLGHYRRFEQDCMPMSFQLLPSTSTNSQLVSRLFHSILTCLFCFFHHCILPSQGCACLRRVLLYAQSTIIQKFPPCLTKLKTNILFPFLCPFLFTPFLKLLLSSSPKHCLFFFYP